VGDRHVGASLERVGAPGDRGVEGLDRGAVELPHDVVAPVQALEHLIERAEARAHPLVDVPGVQHGCPHSLSCAAYVAQLDSTAVGLVSDTASRRTICRVETMASLLLIHSDQTTPWRAGRTGRRERVRPRLWPWRLDVALARGAVPDARGDLSLRAHRLISLRTRQRLAREIRRLLHDAARPRHPLERRLHPGAPDVMDAAPLLYDLADELSQPGPVDAQGVAQVRLLLRDGTGPLYSAPSPGYLEHHLVRALAALTPPDAAG